MSEHDEGITRAGVLGLLADTLDWSRPRWITDELLMEEARRRERAEEGRVEDDGEPPARWVPKESE